MKKIIIIFVIILLPSIVVASEGNEIKMSDIRNFAAGYTGARFRHLENWRLTEKTRGSMLVV